MTKPFLQRICQEIKHSDPNTTKSYQKAKKLPSTSLRSAWPSLPPSSPAPVATIQTVKSLCSAANQSKDSHDVILGPRMSEPILSEASQFQHNLDILQCLLPVFFYLLKTNLLTNTTAEGVLRSVTI